MDHLLLKVLRHVRCGLIVFEPTDDRPEAARTSQPLAHAVIHAYKIGYVDEILPLIDCTRDGSYYQAIVIKRGLTLEGQEAIAAEDDCEDFLQQMVYESIQLDPRGTLKEHWERALLRRLSDARGAIIAANRFLEAVLKWILSQRGHVPPENREKLFEMAVAEIVQGRDHQRLNAVTDHVDTLLRELDALHITIGDARGTSGAAPPLTPALAMLSINVAATLALYLLDAYEEQDVPT